MLKSFIRERFKVVVEYGLRFDDGKGTIFEFPCDMTGRLLPDLDTEMIENYEKCKAHPELYPVYAMIVTYKRRVREDARGICSCGSEIVFSGGYLDSYKCPGCPSIYGHSGNEIVEGGFI